MSEFYLVEDRDERGHPTKVRSLPPEAVSIVFVCGQARSYVVSGIAHPVSPDDIIVRSTL